MPPKAKDKEPPAEPPVNLEELQLHIAQLGDEIATVKENIETRAKDYADSLSTFDVPWPLTSVAHGAGVLFSGSLDNRVLGVDVKAHTDRFEVVAAAPVFCIALLPEAGVLCAGTDCGNIECWNSLNCEPVGELAGHTARVSCLRRPETEQHLWSSSHDGTIRQWDMRELKCVRTFKVCDFQVSSFVLESGTIYAGAWDATVRAIDASTGECTAFFRGHEHIVHALTADKRGQNIYSASGDHKVIQWSVDPSQGFDRTPKARFNGHIDAVLCLHILVLEDFVAAVCGEQAAAAEGDASVRGDTMTVQEMELLRDPCMPAVVLITGSDDRRHALAIENE
eukprot:TRINITY_DN1096_c0_g2_i2.p1 TRINITY_DN1096_c0_g2~~TRINITY_DN1096_c0_g2_i2.p1  ORF type:complete len:338 (-),score=73.80 TRINITY_DN1096_c0_g2_i2:426-1439(-)